MNLSDLVHRTAGDNKVLTTTNSTSTTPTLTTAVTATAATTLVNGNNNNNLFQQSSSLNNVFTNLTRQDPSSFLFNMPNMNQADWINNNLFFNNATDSLIEPIPNNNNILPSNSNNLDTNSFTKRDLLFSNTFLTQRPSPQLQNTQKTTTTTTTTTTYQPPTIAPYPTFNNNNNNNINSITTPPKTATNSPNVTITNKSSPMNKTTSITALSSQVSPIMSLNKQPIIHFSKQMNTPNSISSPNNNSSSSPNTTNTSLSPPPVVKKPSEIHVPKLTITGENVTSNNIEEGYVQFVLNHDPNYISDGIESLVYAKRKFLSVPKTGDLSYTTWDIYELVLKLHKREIKNWSQLVGQLGLADMAGRPQFAQRVKRWMHRYKIDCYFDYLLGNKFIFNAPNEKYSGCLMMGNYKKRTPKDLEDKQKESSEWDEEGAENASQLNKVPVLLAGSRKRMRDHSQNSQQMIESARQFLKTNHTDSEEESQHQMETDEDTDSDEEEEDNAKTDVSMKDVDNNNNEEEEEEEEEEDEEEEVDEEDELASTSSSPGSPIMTTSKINISPKLVAISPTVNQRVSPLTTSCNNCSKQETTINDMRKEIFQLKAYISTLESTVEQQSSMTAQMNKLLRLKDRTERWRKQLIEDLARGPSMISDEDEEDDDVDEDETTDGDI